MFPPEPLAPPRRDRDGASLAGAGSVADPDASSSLRVLGKSKGSSGGGADGSSMALRRNLDILQIIPFREMSQSPPEDV
jgi:hypothetical protein